ncbi:MAG TPA: GntR family transcriptional regulator [Burkholderiales bacterium]|jgi:DNA-binding GntR family transcriptional regulator|nr:GntR family transcriptional regulator [Burkholderiales bacterium]
MLQKEGSLSERVYTSVKNDIFDFRLMPGQRFSENEVSARLGVSRTPVREALYRLGHEGYIEVVSKSGWTVRPFDFEYFENLYDVRAVLELAAVKRLCEVDPMPNLTELKEAWLVPAEERIADGRALGALDERFHQVLVEATGNSEMARIHNDIAQRIRVVRRLEFSIPERVDQTYAEHAQILRAILRRKADAVALMLRTHIEMAKSEVRKITLHKLAIARSVAEQAQKSAPSKRRSKAK